MSLEPLYHNKLSLASDCLSFGFGFPDSLVPQIQGSLVTELPKFWFLILGFVNLLSTLGNIRVQTRSGQGPDLFLTVRT